jgi:hypothetical protein
MTSFRQIEANRRNALRSTGPITEGGKRRSRRNAFRHGLTAETVVETLEDIDDYRGFEAAVIASYDARNAVERELVLRLASLLWRLRRATAIETDLLRIEAETSHDLKTSQAATSSRDMVTSEFSRGRSFLDDVDRDGNDSCNVHRDMWHGPDRRLQAVSPSRDLAWCFLRLINGGAFERLGRYESALSRQSFRTLLLLKHARFRE